MRPVSAAWLLACLAVVATSADTAAEPARLQACDRVLVQIDDPGEAALADRIATSLCRALTRFESLFGRRLAGPVRVRLTADMTSFKSLSGRAWYIAAVLRADRIVLQPGRSLRLLDDPTRPAVHELAHRFIRLSAGRGCPRWLDEGLAQHLSGDRSGRGGPRDPVELRALEQRLGSADVDRRQRERDYRAARALVKRLLAGSDLPALVAALPGLRSTRDPLAVEMAGKSLAHRLFATVRPVDGSTLR